VKDEEAAENTFTVGKIAGKWREPAFITPSQDGTDRGNAMHKAMQYIDFAACGSEMGVQQEIWRLAEEGRITDQQARLISVRKIANFFTSDVGQRLRKAKKVLREFKFSILDEGVSYDPALKEEEILLQGVVDCAVVEEDGITIIDFKTDYVTEESLPQKVSHYRPQVMAYADAMRKIYEKEVKSALLYFFGMDLGVEML
jgi:ATP-dependent helicase/nuclease subunit A